jgi:signal transduction histidine kinase
MKDQANSGPDQATVAAVRITFPAPCEQLSGDYVRLYHEAQAANHLKDEFLATVAHDLRTPLTAVLGWARILRSKKHNEDVTDLALDAIERNARAQAQLIEDLLDLTRITSGKLCLDIRPVDLAALIEAAVNTVRPAAEAKGVRLQAILDLCGELVPGDAGRLQQVLWNLLSNAIKFTPGGGGVLVRLERQGAHAVIIVSDTGRGINPSFLPYIFDRFCQADDSSKRERGSLGLGLAIVHHLVMLHGGAVQAQSGGEGQGATFTVSLPLAALQAGESGMAQGMRLTHNRALRATGAYL